MSLWRPSRTRAEAVNATLTVLAATLAYLAPLELFLFSFALLGPLHYLTEISWLHEHSFFVPGRGHSRLLIPALAALAVPAAVFQSPPLALFATCVGFAAAAGLTLFERSGARVAIVGSASLICLAPWGAGWHTTLFGLLLPTFIHVFFFTAIFMLQGALRSRSGLAYANLALFLACAASFLIVPAAGVGAGGDELLRKNYAMMEPLSRSLAPLVGLGSIGSGDALFDSPAGLSVLRLIAFTYSAHFLNWFGKVKVIRWHQTSRRRLTVIFGAWLLLLATLLADARAGFAALISLSLAHVILEFPLNHAAALGAARGLLTIIGRASAAPPPGHPIRR